MAIAEDASTPAVATATNVSGATGVTTASFSPPAGSLVVVEVSVGYTGAPSGTYTVTDNHSNTYTIGPSVSDTKFTLSLIATHYYTTAPGATTVTAKGSAAVQTGWQVAARVLTGAAVSQTGAASVTAFSATTTTTYEASVTTTTAGSVVYVAASASTTTGTYTPASGETSISAFSDTNENTKYLAGSQTTATVTPGAETFGWTTATGGATYSLAALEILPIPAIIIVQTKSGSTAGATSVTVTLTSATTAGNCLIAALYGTSITGVTLGGSAGNWASQKSLNTALTGTVAIWADPNCAGGQTSIVVTQTANASLSVFVYEVSGLVTTAPLDVSQINGPAALTTSAWTSNATSTSTQASELWVGVVGGYNNLGSATTVTGPSSPWTNETTVVSSVGVFMLTGFQVVTATGAATYAGTSNISGTNNAYIACVATFKAVAAPSAPPRRVIQIPNPAVTRAAWY